MLAVRACTGFLHEEELGKVALICHVSSDVIFLCQGLKARAIEDDTISDRAELLRPLGSQD